MQCDDTNLPEVLTQIRLTTLKQLRKVWAEAERLADVTPSSFSSLFDGILDKVGTDEQLSELERTSQEFVLRPSEVMRVANGLRFNQDFSSQGKYMIFNFV